MGSPFPSGYGLLAHWHNQNWLTRTPSFCDFSYEKGRKAPKSLLQKEGEKTERLFAVVKVENVFTFSHKIHCLQSDFITKRTNVLINTKDYSLGGSPTNLFNYSLWPALLRVLLRSSLHALHRWRPTAPRDPRRRRHLQHRAATSLLPLNKRILFLSVFVFKNPRSLVTSEPYKLRGVGPHSGADVSTFILQNTLCVIFETFSKFSLFSHGKS